MNEERRATLAARLMALPGVHQRILDDAAAGRLPPAVAGAISHEQVASAGRGGLLESAASLDALEAIVQRYGRPPLLVRNGAVELEPLGDDMPAGVDLAIKRAEPWVMSVGRVEFVNFRMSWGGTGWVIDAKGRDRIVATNRHVAKLVATRAADGRGVFARAPLTGARYGAAIDFKEDVATRPGDAAPVTVVEILHLADDAAPDVALLRIVGDGLPDPMPLAEREAQGGEPVALIGYPAYDSRNDAADQARYFRDLYEVKRFAPGLVMQALGPRRLLTHDCTSLGGNSGAPLLSLEQDRVVGLHFAGEYGVSNSAVGVVTLRELLAGRPQAQAQALKTAGEAAGAEGRADGVHAPADLAARDGYDPAFLQAGVEAPWPGVCDALRGGLARPSDASAERPFELRYTHFGVLFSEALRLPVMTGVNIDGSRSVRIKREGDRWFADGRVPLAAQLGQKDYADLQIDRGHMVRREDPNWDPVAGSDAVARLADSDTFHYTNAAPQHSALNQGKQLWQGLENYILDSARTYGFRACVFTGPVIRDDDPEIAPGVRAPLEFWKLVVMVGADGRSPHATAYLLSQGQLIRDLLEHRSRTEAVEGFALGAYRTFQLSVADLGSATGHDLSAYVAADPLRTSGSLQEAFGPDGPSFIPLETLADVVT